MPQLLRIPEVAADTTEATLVDWPLAENAPYATSDAIATVETAKAIVDIEAEADGVLLKRLVTAGTKVAVGEPIALVGAPGEVVDDVEAALLALGVGAAGANGAGANGHHANGAEANGAHGGVTSADIQLDGNGADRIFASPLARRLAREAGLSVEQMSGTGPNGRIVRRDVERAIASEPALVAAAAPAAPISPAAPREAAGWTDTPHSAMRAAIAERLSESKQTIPHFYLRGSARVDKLLRLREELNDGSPVRVSVNDLLVKAFARAHVLVPEMNVIWTPEAIRTFDTVDVAIAVATTRGLVTPVLRSVERTSITAIAATARDLVTRAEAGQLRQHELEGGSATVTNLGMFATEEFAAIINPPQSSILAVGAVRSEPVAVKGKLRVGSVMRVTLSVDHRPIDGATAAKWMRAFLAALEHPLQILA